MSDKVKIYVPGEATLLTTPTGDVISNIALDEDGRRFVMMRVEDAKLVLNSGDPSCIAWIEINRELSEAIGRPAPNPPGINIAQARAAEHEAMTPMSISEITSAIRGAAADTARQIRRFRG
jgi:hypothetical protein